MPILEKAIPFILEIPFGDGGLNEDKDPSTISDADLQVCNKGYFRNGVVEKFPKFVAVNSGNQLESGAALDGTYRCYAKDGTARLIAVCNGKVYESSDWTTPIYTSLTAGKLCQFIPYRGQVIITNGTDYPVLYDPKTNVVGGSSFIESPYQITKIVYFETDETGWSGGAADSESHVDDEWTGDSLQGRKLTAAASTTETMEYAPSNPWLDLSVHPDGSTAIGYDLIDVSVYHRILANISSITVYLETSAGNYYSFTVASTDLDKDEQRDYQWTHLKIWRHQFTATGAPNWNDITKVKLGVTATASGSADPTFDNIRMRRTPPVAWPMRKKVANFLPDEETWTGGSADTTNWKEAGIALKLTDGDETAYCSKSLNLTKWDDGKVLSTSDKMSVWVYINSTANVTEVRLKCGDAGMANYYSYQWDIAGATLAAGANFWQKLSARLYSFSTTGAPSWGSIARIQIEATVAVGGEITFDQWQIDFADDMLSIDDVEYGASGITRSDVGVTWSKQYVYKGSWTAKMDARELGYSQYLSTFSSVKDLTQWADGSPSEDTDWIYFLLTMGYNEGGTDDISPISNLYVMVDVNNGDFETDYYWKMISWADMEPGSWYPGNVKEFAFVKNGFERVGATGGKDWSTVKAIQIVVYSMTSRTANQWFLDNIALVRTTEWKGQLQFKVVHLYGETRSPASEASDWVDVARSKVLLEQVPTSNDGRVKEREVYRKEIGEEDFRFSTKIPNNTSTEWVDDINEPGLTMAEMGVPEGNILPAKGVTGLEYKERILLFQDLDNLSSVAYTDPYLIYAWRSARVLPSEVVGGVVHFDNLFFFLRDGRVYRLPDDIDVSATQPLGEMIKCVSPWGICKVGDEIGLVTEDDIKLFNGYEAKSIGKAISPYLKQEDYKTEESVLFYHKDHLYYRVETRAGGSYKQFVCYVPKVLWEEHKGDAFRCFCAYTGRGDKNELVAGGYDGYVYQLGTTYNDTLEIRTKDHEEVNTELGRGFGFHEKEIQEIRVIARGGDAASGTIQLKVYINGADSGVSVNVPSTGHLATVYHCYIVQLTGVQPALIGQQLGVSLKHATSTKNGLIKAVLISGEVKPLEQQYTQ